jgi:hypothetical protein
MSPPARPEPPTLSLCCCPVCGAVYVGNRESVCPNEKLLGNRPHAALAAR